MGKVGTSRHSLEKQAHGKSRHKQAKFRKVGTWDKQAQVMKRGEKTSNALFL